jgi:tetratricopeptide (TPR) repeat protein
MLRPDRLKTAALVMTVTIALLCVSPVRAANEKPSELVDDALERLARRRNNEALKLYQKKDYPGALALFQTAYKLDPDSAEICNNLAFLYQLLGNYDAAERYYRRTLNLDSERFVAYLNLVDLLAMQSDTPQRLAEASRLLTRAREIRGNVPDLILRQARVAVKSGEFEQGERFFAEYFETESASDVLCIEVGDFFRDFARYDDALNWYRHVDEDGEYGAEAARRIWEIDVDRQARRFGWVKPAKEVSAKARRMAARGRILFHQGQNAEAKKLLREAIAASPHFAEAWADLGDLLRKTDKAAGAELAYLRALAHDNGNAEFHARLAELYRDGSLGARPTEVILFFEKALQLRSDWSALRIKLAAAYKAVGNFQQAIWHIEKYLAETPEDEDRSRILAMKESLEALLPEPSGKTNDPANYPVETDHVLLDALGRVRALLMRGELDSAMAQLESVPEGEWNTEVLNFKARILQSAGRLTEAVSTLETSLQIDPKQDDIYTHLGCILMDVGDYKSSRQRLLYAEQLGDENALYHLARLDAAVWGSRKLLWLSDWSRLFSLLRARGRLDSYLGQGHETRLIHAAHELKSRIDRRLRTLYLQIVALAALAALGALALYWRLYGGIDLKTLISRHPESGPDVQRILSAIRHEVLKHNTMALTGLAEAIGQEGPGAQGKASHIAAGLFGDDGKEAVIDRLRDYADRLRRIGRAYSERLNLTRRDEGLSAIFKGFGILGKWIGDFDRIDSLSPARRAKLLDAIGDATRLLNTQGYEAVRGLLDQLRVLDVDKKILISIHRRILREPAFKDAVFNPAQITISAREPRSILMPRQAFEDVMSNLVRNAAAASWKDNRGKIDIGFVVADDVDEITGVERIALAVKDRSSQTLSAEMLRDRSIDQGLGLTAALVSRYDGTIEILGGDDSWSKAIVVKLPRAPMAVANPEDL